MFLNLMFGIYDGAFVRMVQVIILVLGLFLKQNQIFLKSLVIFIIQYSQVIYTAEFLLPQ
jgi:hypothetical protein